MFNKQEQNTGDCSQLINIGRDFNYNLNNISIEQMQKILSVIGSTVSEQVASHTALARDYITERLQRFESRLLQRFDGRLAADLNAFADPDFQFVVADAAKGFVRCGDEAVALSLVDMIASRSLLTIRSREQLTVNKAITVVPLLTKSEILSLTALFAFRYSIDRQLTSIEDVAIRINKIFSNARNDDLPSSGSVAYLISCGCAYSGGVFEGSFTLPKSVQHIYAGLCQRGLNVDDVERQGGLFGNYLRQIPLRSSTRGSGLSEFDFINLSAFKDWLSINVADHALAAECVVQFEASVLREEEVSSILGQQLEHFEKISLSWSESGLSKLQLNSIGLAIGHAGCVAVTGDLAPLKAWIQ